MKIALVILLIMAGITFLVLEVFLLPGFGVAGVAGFLSLTGAVYIAYVYLTPVYAWAGHITLASCLILSALSIYWFFHKRVIEKVALDATIDSQVSLAPPGKKISNLQNDASQKFTQPENKSTEQQEDFNI